MDFAGAPETADPLAELPGVDLVVSGSVAVTEAGARVGKGEGYSDLEYALLREAGLVDGSTPVVTTVHGLQVVDDAVEVESHDVPTNAVVTPERTIRTDTSFAKPAEIDPDALSTEQIEEIPVLSTLER